MNKSAVLPETEAGEEKSFHTPMVTFACGGLLREVQLNNNQLKLLPESFGDLESLQRLAGTCMWLCFSVV